MNDLFSRIAERATAATSVVRPLMPLRFDSHRVQREIEPVDPLPTVTRENVSYRPPVATTPAAPSVRVLDRSQPEQPPRPLIERVPPEIPNAAPPVARRATVGEPVRVRQTAADVVPAVQSTPRLASAERPAKTTPPRPARRTETPESIEPNVRRRAVEPVPAPAKPVSAERVVARTEAAIRVPTVPVLTPAARNESASVRPREHAAAPTTALRVQLPSQPQPAQETEIHVNIGRIEIRTTAAAPPRVIAPTTPRGPSLQEYLQRSSKRP